MVYMLGILCIRTERRQTVRGVRGWLNYSYLISNKGTTLILRVLLATEPDLRRESVFANSFECVGCFVSRIWTK